MTFLPAIIQFERRLFAFFSTEVNPGTGWCDETGVKLRKIKFNYVHAFPEVNLLQSSDNNCVLWFSTVSDVFRELRESRLRGQTRVDGN